MSAKLTTDKPLNIAQQGHVTKALSSTGWRFITGRDEKGNVVMATGHRKQYTVINITPTGTIERL